MKNIYFRALIIAALVGAISFIFINNIVDKSKKNNDQLIVGTASGYAPFVSLNAQGEYEGFDIDVARELAQRMKKELVIKDCGSMVPLMLSLQNGSTDLLIWALEINKARLAQMAMIQYQGGNITTYPLIFWKEIPQGVTAIEDLQNKQNAVVCFEPGSSQDRFLNKFNFITKKPLEKITDIILDLKYGKSLAALIDPSLLKTLVQKNPEIKVLQVPLDQDYMSYGNGICIKKENTALQQQAQSIIKAMKDDGTLKKLEEKWNL